jgi:hypothetical protein
MRRLFESLLMPVTAILVLGGCTMTSPPFKLYGIGTTL